MDDNIIYESKKQSPLQSEIKQFPTRTVEQQTTGLKRSITTAATLAFIVPLLIIIIYTFFPFSKYPVRIDIDKAKNEETAVIRIENIGIGTIDQMIINLDYQDTYIKSYSYDNPFFCYAHITALGVQKIKIPGSNVEELFRCAFKIENLLPGNIMHIKFVLYPQSRPLKIKEISNAGVFLPWFPGIPVLKYFFKFGNLFYLALFGFVIVFIAKLVLLYFRSNKYSKALDACLSYIFEHFERTKDDPNSEWKRMSIENLFDYWGRIAMRDSKAPKNLKNFRSFVLKYDMMKETHNRSVIYFAPFDTLGSPTFTRTFARNRMVLFLEFLSGQLERYQKEIIGDLLPGQETLRDLRRS